eukprot:TRINITY_DN6098_c0_g1_i1.p1 TRINITY_DN6098_c0_g1~~TRINITY_DN6098_c0_g1_i1.p1  ORF type:complete len:443 (+),score=34.20 TRINITY_DN6098_c0_g1_i1:55-1383(+)
MAPSVDIMADVRTFAFSARQHSLSEHTPIQPTIRLCAGVHDLVPPTEVFEPRPTYGAPSDAFLRRWRCGKRLISPPKRHGKNQLILSSITCYNTAVMCYKQILTNIFGALLDLHCQHGFGVTMNINTIDRYASVLFHLLQKKRNTTMACLESGIFELYVSGCSNPGLWLTGVYREIWAWQRKWYDWFFNTEEDLVWSVRGLLAYMQGYRDVRLPRFVPGVILYERVQNGPKRYVLAMTVRAPNSSAIRSMQRIGKRWYLIPTVQFQPTVLAPRHLVEPHIATREWFEMPYYQIQSQVGISSEVLTAYWFYNPSNVLKAVPVDSLDDFLVHHSTDVYVKPGERHDLSAKKYGLLRSPLGARRCYHTHFSVEELKKILGVFLVNASVAGIAAKALRVRQELCASMCFPSLLVWKSLSADTCTARSIEFRSAECNTVCKCDATPC